MKFDYISDLELWTWENVPDYQPIDWKAHQRNSGAHVIVINGDIHRDPVHVAEELKRIADAYPTVIFNDGNQEHANFPHDLHHAPEKIRELTLDTHNILYFGFDREYIEDGVAFVGCNGWWTFRFSEIDTDGWESLEQIVESRGLSFKDTAAINDMARHQATLLAQSVRALQDIPDIHTIVPVTHTLPRPELIKRPDRRFDRRRYGHVGNRYMADVYKADTNGKMRLWLYGHLHQPARDKISGITYICNPRGTAKEHNDTDPGITPLTLIAQKDFIGNTLSYAIASRSPHLGPRVQPEQ